MNLPLFRRYTSISICIDNAEDLVIKNGGRGQTCMVKIMLFNFHGELDFVLHQRLSNCKNAMMLV